MSAWLFVPATRPDRFDKALAAGATQVIIDLEDAVAPGDKDSARAALAQWLQTTQARVAVRVNSADTAWFEHDLALLRMPAVAVVMLPKAEQVDTLLQVSRHHQHMAIVPLIESGAGLANARSLAAAPQVQRLAFGSIDMQVDLGMRDATEDELLPLRTEIVMASRLAFIAQPLDGVTTAIDDAALLAHDVARSRRLGFGGKLCIHPKQVAGVRAGFTPGADELAWAQRVLAAAGSSAGAAVQVDGKMVDKPVLTRAQNILRDAGL